MKAITVEPKKPGTVRYEDFPEPDVRDGSVLVDAIAVGVCGTDVEIVEGEYGWAPAGHTRLVLGHESLGRVVDPGPAGGLNKGDLVAGIVRRPDPVPCPNCAVGEWDMCRNGQYTERGIKQLDGFMSERWRIEPEYAMKEVLSTDPHVVRCGGRGHGWCAGGFWGTTLPANRVRTDSVG
jgi:threonine dehydrogenase-like Zn-dependent dehydrogenase